MMTPHVNAQFLAWHRSGKLRILAVNAPTRLKAAPDIPAAVEVVPWGNPMTVQTLVE